ncbi:hypothetical protein A4A49_55332 [Nicotiana attenuata]|uniref:KIB1-4 beta-propeller domain-containing protein n=1 Tax=Nicotiana attenuata TaxID=49451 RepID=A0A1J6KGV1_NICAT|nr:hypothetical protein A4A49_55332 [Nicotiana attenuata]
MAMWQEDVPIEIMAMIVKKTISIGNYIRMGAVCKSWRSMLGHDHVKPSDVEAPWLLLLKNCEYDDHIGFNFYSLSDGRFYSFKLPNHILNKYPKVAQGPAYCLSTSNGWLVLIVGPNHNPDMFLFDPISEIDIKLPSFTTIPTLLIRHEYIITSSLVISVQVFSVSDDPTKNLIVAALFLDEVNNREILGFCNCDIGVAEEERLWKIFTDEKNIRYQSLLFHAGKLYALILNQDNEFEPDKSIVDEINHMVVLKADYCEVKLCLIHACDNEVDIAHSGVKYIYLATSITGELLIIWDWTDPHYEDEDEDEDEDNINIRRTSKLTIQRYDDMYKTSKKFEYVTNLGDQAVFVSPNSTSFSIHATSGNECQENCVYFTVDAINTLGKKSRTLNRQSGIYCMQEGRIIRPFPYPPIWFQPRLRN